MNFEFEDFVIREVGHEQRTMQTSKKVNNVLTDVTIFQVKGLNESFDLLYCVGKNGDSWVVAEKIESLSHHLHRAQRTRMSIEKFKEIITAAFGKKLKKVKIGAKLRKVYLYQSLVNTVKTQYVRLFQNLEQRLELWRSWSMKQIKIENSMPCFFHLRK